MDQQRYCRLKALTQKALELEAADRRAYLERECGDDQDLLLEIQDLLALDGSAAADQNLTVTFTDDLPDLSGRTFGPYKILQPLGEGGMGVVYLASQTAPLRRKVALKVIKLGMDTREVISRFEAERQALALMDHPNIAKVFDAGATDTGRPFFVMEHIQGVPLLRYCDQNRLSLQARLDLFVQVCRGIQHAHQKGLIHRDIKPGNILVSEVEGLPVPKIIDFGVAKSVGAQLAAHTLFTQQGRLIGTPEYMSPEQADPAGADVDTRSDVYSLGVVLYQLLTGVLPMERHDILRAGFERMGRAVAEWTPAKPSTRLHEASTTDTEQQTTLVGVDTRVWKKRVRGDLDWITMKALEKERDRRYESPTALAEDLKRHMENRPVTAGPPSGWYRARKFARRNRTGVAVGLALLTALLAGTIGTTVGMIRANRAEAEAVAAADKAVAAVLFQLSRSEENPALALPYILAALERDDKLDYRVQAKRCLLAGPPCWRLPDVEDGINPGDMDISPDGRWLAAGWGTGVVQLFSFAGGGPQILYNEDPNRIADHMNQYIRWCRFSPDSRYLVTASRDSLVEIWRPDGARLVRSLKFDGVTCPFFDLERQVLITVTRYGDGRTRWRSWPLSGGEAVDLGTSGELADSFPCDLDPVRRRLVQARGDSIFLFDFDRLEAGPVHLVGRHDAFIDALKLAPDGRTAVVASRSGAESLWDVETPGGDPLGRNQGPTRPQYAEFDPAGVKIAVAGLSGLFIWDLQACSAAVPTKVLGPGYWMFSGNFHPDGNWLVSTGQDRGLTAWPLVNESPLTLDLGDALVDDMEFTPDGKHFVVAMRDGAVWDVPLEGTEFGDPVLLYDNGFGRYCNMSFDGAGRYVFLALCGAPDLGGDLVRVPLDGGPARVIPDVGSMYCVDVPGRRVAFVSEADGIVVRVLDLETGETRDLDQIPGGVSRIGGFDPDGRLFVGVAGDYWGFWDDANEVFTPIDPSGLREIALTEDRRSLLGRDADFGMWRRDPGDTAWSRVELDHPSYAFPGATGVTFDVSAKYMISGVHDNYDYSVIIDMTTGEKFLYPLFDDESGWGVIDPMKRWVAVTSRQPDGIIRIIRRPSGTPFEALPREEMLARLRALTCLRAVPDEDAQLGFSIEGLGIPDWANPPTW